jgi:diguanylate cyclase (GGDEF)-like protein
MLDPNCQEPNNIHLETEGKDINHRKFALELVISSTNIGKLFILSVFARDVTERQRWNEKVRNLAYFDHLTKLPNRQSFKEHVGMAVNAAKRHNKRCAILYLDLDEFKRINDTLGHERGDLLLVGVSDRLVECLRGSDIVGCSGVPFEHERCIARLGGDEFTVLLDDVDSPEAIGVITDMVITSIAGIYDLNGHEVYVTTSIGIAIYPDDGGDVEALLKNADTAMYHAKSVGKNNYQFYTSKMNTLVASRLKLEGELRKALCEKEFKLYYQPQIDLVTRKIVSAEALLRFSRPELSEIPILDLIQIAEETGMIIDLGEWVFNEACRQNSEWQDAGYPHMRVSVNLSNMQFLQHDLNDRIESALKRHKLSPEYLGLEITESTVMQNVDDTINALTAFKRMGMSISIDDFGTGHSSLSHLKRLPLDTLKIDRSFIKDTPNNHDDTIITSAIIAMAHRLNLEIVAEGIETEVQRDYLQQQGCQMGQGFLFSKPLPPEMFSELIDSNIGDTHTVSDVILPC